MRTWFGILATVVFVAAAAGFASAEEGFMPLFDGQTLAGWEGDPAFWSVADGAIVGLTTEQQPTKHNTFLCSTKTYRNFVLKAEFRLRNGNSGIQVRSKRSDDFIVGGYQADIADKRFMGILYDERGSRGILADVDEKKVSEHVKPGEWNEYTITCDGGKITLAINGFTTVEYEEKGEGAKEGIIALQVHAGPPMQIAFRNLRIKELP